MGQIIDDELLGRGGVGVMIWHKQIANITYLDRHSKQSHYGPFAATPDTEDAVSWSPMYDGRVSGWFNYIADNYWTVVDIKELFI